MDILPAAGGPPDAYVDQDAITAFQWNVEADVAVAVAAVGRLAVEGKRDGSERAPATAGVAGADEVAVRVCDSVPDAHFHHSAPLRLCGKGPAERGEDDAKTDDDGLHQVPFLADTASRDVPLHLE